MSIRITFLLLLLAAFGVDLSRSTIATEWGRAAQSSETEETSESMLFRTVRARDQRELSPAPRKTRWALDVLGLLRPAVLRHETVRSSLRLISSSNGLGFPLLV